MTAKMWKYEARTKRLLGRPAGEASVTLVDERGTTHAPSLSLLYSRRQFERARNERRARRGPSTSLIGHWDRPFLYVKRSPLFGRHPKLLTVNKLYMY